MKKIVNQLTPFILPITVLIFIPLIIERNILIKNIYTLLSGLTVISPGLFLMISTIVSFIRIGKGTLAPWNPTRKLVIAGIYKYVRNPMITGVLIVLIGESILFLSIKIMIWAVIFFILNTVYFILIEEPGLEKKFGDEYRKYKKNVHRWIPRLKPYNPDTISK